jgi:hypothetical protein
MDYAAAATSVTAAVTGLTTLGIAGFAVFLLIKGFTWGRRIVK